MKKHIFILITTIALLISCSPKVEKTELFIEDFFNSYAQFTCSDSLRGNVRMKFLYNQLNMETMSFEFVIPDSIQFSDFYNAYMGRLAGAYFKSRQSDKNKSLDSLFQDSSCDVEKVKGNIIDFYCNDIVFFEVFRTALNSFYVNKNEIEEYETSKDFTRVVFTVDSLVQLALLQFDIVDYDTERGFAYHFVCGENPYNYSVENSANLLVIGFCQEALRNKEMYDAHTAIMKQLKERFTDNNEYDESKTDELCMKCQNELHQMLLEDGTLLNCILAYYEMRKDIEPFKITDSRI